MNIVCPHCGGELELDKKTGALICKVCHCVFRVCLTRYDTKCYAKTHKKEIKELMKEGKKEKKHGKRGRPKDPIKVLHESMKENKEVLEALSHGHLKKRRGRPRKIKEEVS